MKLGQTIQDIRDANNMTQEDFGNLFHVTRQTVSNWENGKSYPDLITLIEISDMFNVSLDTMLKGDRKMIEKLNKEIDWSKRLKVVLPITFGALIICVGLFFWLYWGIVPVNSDEMEITTNATYIENLVDDGISQGPEYRVDFYFKLKNGKCIDMRESREDEVIDDSSWKKVLIPYDQYRMPFDDRGEYPGEEDISRSKDRPFTEGDVIIVKFKDKTVEYSLKEIAEAAGIQ